MEAYREKKRKVIRCKKEVNDQFGRKIDKIQIEIGRGLGLKLYK